MNAVKSTEYVQNIPFNHKFSLAVEAEQVSPNGPAIIPGLKPGLFIWSWACEKLAKYKDYVVIMLSFLLLSMYMSVDHFYSWPSSKCFNSYIYFTVKYSIKKSRSIIIRWFVFSYLYSETETSLHASLNKYCYNYLLRAVAHGSVTS